MNGYSSSMASADPMVAAMDKGVQWFTFAAAGYVSGRMNNPKVGPVPFELLLGIPFTALGLAALVTGTIPMAGRAADQVGTVLLGTYLYKFMAGMGKSHAPAGAAASVTAPPKPAAAAGGFRRGEITGGAAGFNRGEIVGAGMGALSAAEAARLAR